MNLVSSTSTLHWVWRGVAAIAMGGLASAATPDEVLARLRSVIQGYTARVPNYSCVETIERWTLTYSRQPGGPSADCGILAALKNGHGLGAPPMLTRWERLRLDVRVGQSGEEYSWVDAGRFDDRELSNLIGGMGATATGPFGALLLGIFQNDRASISFSKERLVNGRSLLEYSFKVPLEKSNFYIQIRPQPVETAGYSGAFLVDPLDLRLASLEYTVSPLPANLDYCAMRGELRYRNVRIGDADYPLPELAQQTFSPRSMQDNRNVVTFSSCREYRAESTLIPAGGAAGPAEAKPAAAAAPGLPWNLPVVTELTSAIDSATAARGDPFTARLTKPIKQDGKTLVPTGAIVRGRLSYVGGMDAPAAMVHIGLRPEIIEFGGRSVPFVATGKAAAESVWRNGNFRSRGVPLDPALLQGWGVDSLSFRERRKVLTPGFRMEWITGAK